VPNASPAADALPRPGWAAFLQWSTEHDETLARLCRQYERDSLYGMECKLPGPTGESNVLRFIERGTVCCAAADTASLLNQLAAVLATGNVPILSSSSTALLPAGLPAEAAQAIRHVAATSDCPDLALALYDRESVAVLNDILARKGALVPAVCTSAQTAIPLWRLTAEKTICINTAAAGGNAALMTMQS
jgi:RHH-type proline utilization regulon transcriptional repressor/proline dehydrogenase/delta 1-pyrroline-5-carboxylate dehydrogenase